MKINKLWTKLKSFLFGKKKETASKDKSALQKEEKQEVFGNSSIRYRRASHYAPGFYEGNSENGFNFRTRHQKRNRKHNRITMKKRLQIKHKHKAA